MAQLVMTTEGKYPGRCFVEVGRKDASKNDVWFSRMSTFWRGGEVVERVGVRGGWG